LSEVTVAGLRRDAAVAAGAATAVLAAALWESAAQPFVLAGLTAAVCLPLTLRRRFPVAVAVVVGAAALAGAGVDGWSGRLVVAGAFCSAAYHRPRNVVSLVTLSVGLVAVSMLGATPFEGDTLGPPSLVDSAAHVRVAVQGAGITPLAQTILIGIAPVAAGYALRIHRERAEQVARMHQLEAARTVAEERTQLARDVHDSVGHHLTAIAMQANAARYVLGDTPVLATIGELAASALVEVRGLLTALRDDDPASAGGRLADIPALAERLATTGCPIEVACDSVGVLPERIDRGAYRLVQEALTNAIRHADASRIWVCIKKQDHTLTVTVADDGSTMPPSALIVALSGKLDLLAGSPGSRDGQLGHGVRGMRDRARGLGGHLAILPRMPHGWLVEAVLPLGPS
jgi:signal transduction histidine kinase